MLFHWIMKAEVLQRSLILRYDGEYGSLSALRLSASPTVVDRETNDLRGVGEVVFRGSEDLTLAYGEEESGIRVTLEKAGDRLTVTRGGTELRFELGSATAFSYRTAYGTLPTEAFTEQLTLQKKGTTALLTLVYTAVLGGMAQKNELRFKITTNAL